MIGQCRSCDAVVLNLVFIVIYALSLNASFWSFFFLQDNSGGVQRWRWHVFQCCNIIEEQVFTKQSWLLIHVDLGLHRRRWGQRTRIFFLTQTEFQMTSKISLSFERNVCNKAIKVWKVSHLQKSEDKGWWIQLDHSDSEYDVQTYTPWANVQSNTSGMM